MDYETDFEEEDVFVEAYQISTGFGSSHGTKSRAGLKANHGKG